jgi:hypothetical protein
LPSFVLSFLTRCAGAFRHLPLRNSSRPPALLLQLRIRPLVFQGQTPYKFIAERHGYALVINSVSYPTHNIAKCDGMLVVSLHRTPMIEKSFRRLIYTRLPAVVQDPLFPEPLSSTPPTFTSVLAQSKSAERMHSVLPISVSTRLSTDGRIAPSPMEISARRLRDSNVPSSPQFCASPQSRLACDGWCVPDPNVKAPTVVGFFLYVALKPSIYLCFFLFRCRWQHAQMISSRGRLTRAR